MLGCRKHKLESRLLGEIPITSDMQMTSPLRQRVKRLFSSSLLSAIRMVSSAYLRLSIFLPAILIPACASSSTTFCMVYSAYKLNKQGDNIQPWHTAFLIWNQSLVPCPVLTVASWPAYRFHRRQVRWSGIPISLRIFHSLLWSTQSEAASSRFMYCWSLAWRILSITLLACDMSAIGV